MSNFRLNQTLGGTAADVNEDVASTTPDSSFRRDPTAQQWTFNMSTKPLLKNVTYVC